MALMRTAAVLGFCALVTIGSLAGAGQTQEKYKVRLSPVPMDGGMRSTVAGGGAATAVLAGSKLTITGTFEGLLSPATTARVHRGPAMGVRGPSFADLTITKTQKGTISGAVDLAPEQVRALKVGQIYMQISSEKAPEGNLWGWFVR
jgi:CHRD domain-containing protein